MRRVATAFAWLAERSLTLRRAAPEGRVADGEGFGPPIPAPVNIQPVFQALKPTKSPKT
jgi:hypothetical protein